MNRKRRTEVALNRTSHALEAFILLLIGFSVWYSANTWKEGLVIFLCSLGISILTAFLADVNKRRKLLC